MARERSTGSGLWARCKAAVDRLDLPDPFTAESFIDTIARERGRPIDLMPIAARSGLPCGLVVTTRNADWIMYCADTTALHRQHILLHEAAHIICGHSQRDGDGSAMAAAAQVLMPHLPLELVRSVLGRSVYSATDEQEAELTASLILHRVGRRARRPDRSGNPPSELDAVYGVDDG